MRNPPSSSPSNWKLKHTMEKSQSNPPSSSPSNRKHTMEKSQRNRTQLKYKQVHSVSLWQKSNTSILVDDVKSCNGVWWMAWKGTSRPFPKKFLLKAKRDEPPSDKRFPNEPRAAPALIALQTLVSFGKGFFHQLKSAETKERYHERSLFGEGEARVE